MKTIGTMLMLAAAMFAASAEAARPAPRPELAKRIAAGDCEVYGIVHYGLNTYTDREWGYGDEDPKLFDPKAFDADQIVGACKAGGLQGLVVVAKHHDGFCLWPTKTTEHNIARSPFRGGKGDYVREMERACRKAGLKFGVYVSPWDRNSAVYATDKYVELYHAQIRELLNGDYGEIFEMWFDGAFGGDGYYGGAREKRRITGDYYRFGEIFRFVRELQPSVCIFNERDEADFRWPGNECGRLDPDCCATVPHHDPDNYDPYYGWCGIGRLDGSTFHPAEADFPMRPGWFHHASERGKTKSAAYLMQRYLGTVGNGGTMNLGISPNRDGCLDDEDVKALAGLGALKSAFFSKPASGNELCNVAVMTEEVSKGEYVNGWKLSVDGKPLLAGKAIGIKRIRILPQAVPAAKLKLDVTVIEPPPSGHKVTVKCFYADPELIKVIESATTESGETDTAKWMTGAITAAETRAGDGGREPDGMWLMLHRLPADQQAWIDAVAAHGCAGVTVQCPGANGFTSNPANVAAYGEFLKKLRASGLSYWIYDEDGYPSGIGGGLPLKDHPEYEARGFYMRKFVAVDEKRTFDFRRECDAEKIVWAAKYSLTKGRTLGDVIWSSYRPVPFTDDAASATIGPDEAFYVFSVRTAYEGAHLVYNVCSRRRAINIMDPKAVRRFIDVAYEPIARALPNAYAESKGVFTDEPSLQTCFINTPSVSWNWAMLPWKEGLFDDYAEAYGGERMEKTLPALFEGGLYDPAVCCARVRFHELVGKLVAKAWSRQLADWCKAHGTRFSGHYLTEESLKYHVGMYGNLFSVLKEVDYPGIDMLECQPEIYDFRAAKYAQLAMRKKCASGMMAEVCPFSDRIGFYRCPVEHYRVLAAEMGISGVRDFHSYSQPDIGAYLAGRPAGRTSLAYPDAVEINANLARLSSALAGRIPTCSVFVYVNVNEIQARYVPEHSTRPMIDDGGPFETSMTETARRIYESGHDFMFVDDDDIVAAGADEESRISGMQARVVVIPPSTVMSKRTFLSLLTLEARGVKTLFLDQVPDLGTDGAEIPKSLKQRVRPRTAEDVDEAVRAADSEFAFRAEMPRVLHATFPSSDGDLHFLVNRNRRAVPLTVTASPCKSGRLEDLTTGKSVDWHFGDTFEMPALGAVMLRLRP